LGRTLAKKYEVQSRIAEGGMATVYRARVVDVPGEVVALKVLHPALSGDRTFEVRFRREARLAARLHHPNIVRVKDYASDGGVFFLAMELLEGRDLHDELRHEGVLDQRLAMHVAISVCEGLAEAHGQGFIHRDLKTENVFLVPTDDPLEPEVKVLDFGIARILDPDEIISSDSMPALTSAGSLLGTPEYMSPEQCRGESATPVSDVYAVGVLLYTMLTGAPPFRAKNPLEVTLKHLRDAPLPPSAFRPGLSSELERLILQALAKRPADRPRSAQAFADALRVLLPKRVVDSERAPPSSPPSSMIRAIARIEAPPAAEPTAPEIAERAPAISSIPAIIPPPPTEPAILEAPLAMPAAYRPPPTFELTPPPAPALPIWAIAALVFTGLMLTFGVLLSLR
jgi:serine/threonine-protein kinase